MKIVLKIIYYCTKGSNFGWRHFFLDLLKIKFCQRAWSSVLQSYDTARSDDARIPT